MRHDATRAPWTIRSTASQIWLRSMPSIKEGSSLGGLDLHRSQRIYVVDDDPEVLRVLEKFLSQAGFEVRTASDSTGLFGVLATFRPDLILLDLGLPCDDDFTLAREIWATSDVPIIMLTDRTDEVDRIVGLELGADDYVTKPFSPRELLARIKAVLRRTGKRTDRAWLTRCLCASMAS